MRGTVTKRNNKWQAMWYTHKKIDGKPERKSKCGFATKKAAQIFLAQKILEVEATVYTSGKRNTLGAYLLYWLEEHSRRISPNTYRGYLVNIEKHINPVIGSVYLDKLSDTDIDKVFKQMHENGHGGTTQKYVYSVLRKALNHAVRRKIIPYNVVDMVESPKKEKYHPTIIPRERLQHFKECLEETDIYIPIFLCLGLGLRRGEMLGLRWSDINFDTGIMFIQRSATPAKGGYRIDDTKSENSHRMILLPQSVINDLKNHREQQTKDGIYKADGYVNINSKGDIISASILNKKFKKFLTDSNFPDMRIHDLRHSYATLMLEKGLQMKITSQILGHSSVGITSDIYSHMQIGMQGRAAEIVDDVFS